MVLFKLQAVPHLFVFLFVPTMHAWLVSQIPNNRHANAGGTVHAFAGIRSWPRAAKAYRPGSYRQTRASAGCGLHGRLLLYLCVEVLGFAGKGGHGALVLSLSVTTRG